ncbi:hypothetical protein GIV96_22515 [Pseudomonas syringae]|uniref:Bacteriocin immunity protein n=2 Tax=Pseudomonas fragariae (ex Marin et al. 2024) TaxID=3080056 RepID=A0ABT3LLV5_9PSED|nr:MULTISPECIES: bacteriocin immunity protein [Pseudomonas]MCW6057443.1 bacteriocin immunity protein [Pseudomonas fragi]MCF5028682.1 hypothetical protein [Pseudomonas syringae]MCF5182415.1 hypothetical protein [Pseudomonas syringae]MCF5316252.1 hypothetical protein [Pseudomonas syringae]MCF5363358.1 hypothetical protein [Pseudomonas syringae]
MEFKSALAGYTEHEFKALVDTMDDAGTEEDCGELVEHFNKVVLADQRPQ